MNILRFSVLFLGLLSAQVLVAAEEASSMSVEELPVELFFKNPEFRSFKVSPDGSTLAVLAPWKGYMNLYAMDLATRQVNVLTGLDKDISDFSWINSDRLIFHISDLTDREYETSGATYAIDKDGQNHTILVRPVKYQIEGANYAPEVIRIISRYKQDPNKVLVSSNKRRQMYPDLYLMDARRGENYKKMYFKNPSNYNSFVLDENDVPRIAYKYFDSEGTYDDGSSDVYYRKNADSEWELLFHFSGFDDPLDILNITGDEMLVSSRGDGDRKAIYRYDLEQRKLSEKPLCEDSVYDVEPNSYITSLKTDRIVGLTYDAEKPTNVFFYKKYQQLQAMIDSVLSDTYNKISSKDDDGKYVVITSYSDVQFPVYYLLHMDSFKMEKIGEAANWLKADQLCHTKPIHYKARDGRTIYGYLTLPKNWKEGSSVPLIVNPHGGPWARDSWGLTWFFDNEQQFYANRGFAVLKVNFRGSTGYGHDHLVSGYKHADIMENDVTDGVLWAIDQGYADRSCIGIAGASWGGYSTMYGVTKEPELYAFGMNWMGVVDMPKQIYRYRKWGSDRGYNQWSVMIGDPDNPEERKLLEEWSPINYIENIKCPLFIYHGLDDMNVHIEQEYELVGALDKFNKEYVEVLRKDELHSAFDEKNRIDTYKKVDKFLKRFNK